MKQLLQNLRTGETYVTDVPVPNLKPGTILVKTAASLVSAGTERMLVDFAGKSLVGKARSRPDLVRQALDKARRQGLLTTVEAALNRLDQPLPLGYSSAGTVVAVGGGIEDVRSGDRVACAGGGYAVHAEYASVPANLYTILPPKVDFESGAFATLGAISMHGFRLAQTQVGERIVVVGLGLLGQLAVRIALAAGCEVLGVDLDPTRVAMAERSGAEAVVREGAEVVARSFARGRGVDAVLICADTVSNDPVQFAGNIARDRARVVAVGAVGLDIPRKIYYEKELTLLVSRSYGPGRYDPFYEEQGHDYPIGYVRWTEGRNLEAFIELIANGRLEARSLITHRFSIEEAPEAYNLIAGRKEEPFLGVLLTYPKSGQSNFERLKVVEKDATSLVISKSKTVKLGVLGAGNFANAVLLPVLNKIGNIELMGIASASGLSARHAMDKYHFRYATSDERDILGDSQVNTIAVLTRHQHHARQIVAALKAEKHVFCEKPLALTETELEEIENSLQKSRSNLLCVGFNRRFAPMAQKLSDFLKDRTEPLYAQYRVNAGYLPPGHWLHDPEQGGGRILGEGCHFVDFLSFLVGAPPETVLAEGLPDLGRYRQDNVQLTLTFPDGSIGTVIYLANGDASFPKERVEVFAGGRIAVLEDYRRLETIHEGRKEVHRSRLRQDKGHLGEWEAFVRAIANGGPAPIPYSHLLGGAKATFAALVSLKSGEKISL